MTVQNPVADWICDLPMKRMRLYLRSSSLRVIRMQVAAILIQRAWRRHLVRVDYNYPLNPRWSMRFNTVTNYASPASGVKLYTIYIDHLRHVKPIGERAVATAHPHFCATKIQSTVRAWLVHRMYRFHRFMYETAAVAIQRRWRARSPRFREFSSAARVIQRAWRTFAFRVVFMYYRDLITFEQRGDPRRILHLINPAEAALMDAAVGSTVRFRLGGVRFPPTVYYKIFTSRVVDLNAFAPRDYHDQACRAAGGAPSTDPDFWYRRVDYNTWRPVRDEVILDPATQQRVVDVVEERAMRISEPVKTLDRAAVARRRVRRRKAEWEKAWMDQTEGKPKEGEEKEGVLEWADSIAMPTELDFETYLADWHATGQLDKGVASPAVTDEPRVRSRIEMFLEVPPEI